ncbi:conserved exported hypothetical protein [Desulfamplus magnetovallimortis]|uniref:DUF3450 domain-containing protein n=1 Tax=Desulfamplus magnetovallimortis TaxID=1246637 RepID=A0A1W1HB15_9BACT|nr:DUF3450 domain-containing protein [Desulfamplus magnetovallimortis]SLM29691.1 conserved exported hypothetical protein [Desulfamplus magnetovallimortis]
MIGRYFLMFILVPFFITCAYAGDTTAEIAESSVTKSIETRQATQQEIDKWEEEKLQLQAEYDNLMQENELLAATQKVLSLEVAQRRENVESLKVQQNENEEIERELLPFLESLYAELNEFVLQDTLFLREERRGRMAGLARVMEQIDLTIAEKYRKLMEALFIEAEYGNTIEVTREKIDIGGNGEEIVADIFRLGRISLFALTLDRNEAASFNVAQHKWLPLNPIHIPAIQSAVEIAQKQRSVEILAMPLGSLKVQ